MERINVQLPPEMLEKLDQYVADGQFSSRAEYIRYIIREWFEQLEERARG